MSTREAIIAKVREGWPIAGSRHYDVRGETVAVPPVRDGGMTAALIDFAVDTAIAELETSK